MSVADRLERILARMTPEYLQDIILRLSAAQSADTRASRFVARYHGCR
jgi:hypothetical protein